ncbi:WD40-repeat-containing domain protein [Lanmaoa asiatica]|nr:WD40-repeat-containing domain protein [Lanmaoa asiatica]
MKAGSAVSNVAVSRDGKWIVSGSHKVMVWNAESYEKVTEFSGHTDGLQAVDVSPDYPDGTRIATGSVDKTACVWSLSTGQRLLGPLKHDYWVVAAKFSPDGRLIRYCYVVQQISSGLRQSERPHPR